MMVCHHTTRCCRCCSQFALQLSQVNGSFSIRPLVSIASKANAIPIYADDGSATGMSTSSVMSMLPPLQSVSITRKSEDNGREVTSMTKSAHWRFLGVNGTSRADGSEATYMSSHGLRLRALAATHGAGNIRVCGYTPSTALSARAPQRWKWRWSCITSLTLPRLSTLASSLLSAMLMREIG